MQFTPMTLNLKTQQQQENTDLVQKEHIRSLQTTQNTIIIVGCSHAGTLAAITLRQQDPSLRIQVFEQNGEISFLQCGIHLAINKTCTDQTKMFYNSPQNLRKMGIEIFTESTVSSFDFENQLVNTIVRGEKKQFQYSKTIVACGSAPIIPPIIGNIDYTKDVQQQMRKLQRILLCKNYQDSLRLAKLYKPSKVCIIGAGLVGMELAWAYSQLGSKVSVVDHGERILGKYFDQDYTDILTLQCKELKIEILSSARICKMYECISEVTVIIEQKIDTNVKTIQQSFDYVILAAGFRPNTNFITQNNQKVIKNMKNVIITDNLCHTSIKNVYAIGDCSTTMSFIKNQCSYIPLTTIAIRQGLTAAYDITGTQLKNAGSNGTTAIQIFDYSMASTGLMQNEAKKLENSMSRVVYSDYLYHKYCNKKLEKVVQHETLNKKFDLYGDIVRGLADQVVDSFEIDFDQQEDQIVSVSVVFDLLSGKIYGNQSMGKQDITQQTNAVSVAITTGLTLDELAQIDFGGFCGEEKPWNVLAVAAASKDLDTVDFELE